MDFSFNIPLAPEKVWELWFGDEMQHLPEIVPHVLEVRDYQMRRDGTPEYVEVIKSGPMRYAPRCDHYIFDPASKAVCRRLDVAVGGEFTIELQETSAGTRMTHAWDLESPNPLIRPFLPLVARSAQRSASAETDTIVDRMVNHDTFCILGA